MRREPRRHCKSGSKRASGTPKKEAAGNHRQPLQNTNAPVKRRRQNYCALFAAALAPLAAALAVSAAAFAVSAAFAAFMSAFVAFMSTGAFMSAVAFMSVAFM